MPRRGGKRRSRGRAAIPPAKRPARRAPDKRDPEEVGLAAKVALQLIECPTFGVVWEGGHAGVRMAPIGVAMPDGEPVVTSIPRAICARCGRVPEAMAVRRDCPRLQPEEVAVGLTLGVAELFAEPEPESGLILPGSG